MHEELYTGTREQKIDPVNNGNAGKFEGSDGNIYITDKLEGCQDLNWATIIA